MRVYLASRYGRKAELQAARATLQSMGHEVTSRWLDTSWENGDSTAAAHVPEEHRAEWAKNDLDDVASSDVVVSFTEDGITRGTNRGGRHVEFGYALALGKWMVLIGSPENLFHYTSGVLTYETFEKFVEALTTDDEWE
jgi:nucleoside 2-deoxyribosyltransferase